MSDAGNDAGDLAQEAQREIEQQRWILDALDEAAKEYAKIPDYARPVITTP